MLYFLSGTQPTEYPMHSEYEAKELLSKELERAFHNIHVIPVCCCEQLFFLFFLCGLEEHVHLHYSKETLG